ncbi:hypothetical protein [Methylorubrum sp. GM97]|uniref:hypothetical protein n=1 Tax=Methylorubrum sp. GM97 TaxID=2938232 RepID=UPI002185AF5A|nr:hypothetical protein [Methylorubrum sp. GM97]BDL39089.1 hypothetical protein MSPGM_16790 [Methylorubrum sp. GM97]
MTDIANRAVSILAGEVAASGTRPAADVASGILARLQREGLAIVDVSQVDAVEALIALDAILDLRGAAGDEEVVREWASQMGMDSPSGLMAAVSAVRDVLDGPQAPIFDAATLRDAYRHGYDRSRYSAGGDPAAYDHEGAEYGYSWPPT